jgi:acyl transferase domain-containing protein/acyl carrier protein
MEPLAIVGMAARFPGADTLEQYWDNLCRGVESITFFSDEELAAAGVAPELIHNPRFVRARGVMQGAELFDHVFFGLSPREARHIEPQHRVFLESAWEALERAGYAPSAQPLNVGVYAGASMNTYLLETALDNPEALLEAGGFQVLLGHDKDFVATRVSYKLNLRGPALTVQTACSTSLVAVTLACQSLTSHQCDMALAGGVSIIAPRVSGYMYEAGMILSPDGHCRAFDARAKGTVLGEGVGVVVLKRLNDALADGDHIHAVLRAAALNNDGSLKVGYTAPSVDGQAEVIARAHAMADVDPETITYVETHGTGTELGDPIEIAGLTKAFRMRTQERGFCAIGSVKTNIGHLDAAAGVAGLIKTVLALEHHTLPPSLHFVEPNAAIDFGATPFYVNTKAVEWRTAGDAPRRAGVSSFGIGGTNAHAVLEEAPQACPGEPSRPVQILTLSAKSESALERASGELAAHLSAHSDVDCADVAFTLHRGRPCFPHRRFVVADGTAQAAAALARKDASSVFSAIESESNRPVVFLFPGQGSQYVGMGRGLYETEPGFREPVDLCSELLTRHLGMDLRRILYPATAGLEEAQARLATTAITQPALFVIEYALSQLLMEWGLRPRAMLGHSIGEYVAACLAGVLSLEHALALVARRGRLMEIPGGAMLVVPIAARELALRLPTGLSIAAVNGPELCAVSGPAMDIEAFKERLEQEGIPAQPIRAASAFHSAMMDPVLGAFTDAARAVPLASPAIPYLSNVSGTWITAEEATDPGYWARHIRRTVRFWEGLQEVTREGDPILLEVGPGHTLSSLARQIPRPARSVRVFSTVRHPRDEQSDATVLQLTLGRLWLAGAAIDWAAYHARERRRRVPLPTYPFERQRHWFPPGPKRPPAPVRIDQLARRTDPAAWLYAPSWYRSRGRAPAESLAGNWLIFSDESALATALALRLRSSAARTLIVKEGAAYSPSSGGVIVVNPRERSDYDRLVAELKAANAFPLRVLHLWSMAPDASAFGGIGEAADADQVRGFFSLFFLSQALNEQRVREDVIIGVVVNSLYDVVGDVVLQPARATALGPAMAIPRECPNISCRMIDVIAPANAPGIEQVAEQLVGELEQPAEMSIVAYRGKHRWVQHVEPVQLPRPHRGELLRSRGVYLITGGLGGIGLVLARRLAERVRARLVLTARGALPRREEWNSLLERSAEGDATATRIRAVLALEEAGAEVMVLSADVAEPADMQRVVRQVCERFGAINGVIHAAGVVEPGIIQLKTPEVAQRVIRAKLAGTNVLWRAVPEDALDFVFLCSSISAIVSGPGLADYRAANAFLDAFAHSQAGQSRTRIVSVNWDTWSQVGMAVISGDPNDLRNGIRPEEGAELFEQILESDLTQVIVSTRDLPQFIALAAQEQGSANEEVPHPNTDAPSESAAGSQTRAGLSSEFVPPATEYERSVAQIWQKLLGIEAIGLHDNFFEAGGHSLLATRLMSRLYERFGIDVPLRTVFEAPTVGAFAERVERLVATAGAEREEIEL